MLGFACQFFSSPMVPDSTCLSLLRIRRSSRPTIDPTKQLRFLLSISAACSRLGELFFSALRLTTNQSQPFEPNYHHPPISQTLLTSKCAPSRKRRHRLSSRSLPTTPETLSRTSSRPSTTPPMPTATFSVYTAIASTMSDFQLPT